MFIISDIKRDFGSLSKEKKGWVVLATLCTLVLSLATKEPMLRIMGAVANILFVIMVANKKISTYYFGAIGVAIYSYIAFQNKYYGDFMVNALYHFPTQFIGWYLWHKKGNEENIIPRELNFHHRVALFFGSILAICSYGIVLKMLGGHLPFVDSASTILSIIAMLLMMNQYKEQWYFWICVNTITVFMWSNIVITTSTCYATLCQWIVFLLNSLYGFYIWNKKDN